MILYPTETLYALGVNAFDNNAVQKLTDLKGRDSDKFTSVLVRNITDIDRWAILSETACQIAESFLPGPLTLVLPAKDTTSYLSISPDQNLRFRISPDQITQQTITDFMAEYDAPLTCTSANVSGQPPASTPQEILAQFAEHNRDISAITQVIDDGPRSGVASTVVKVIGDEITVFREGAISAASLHNLIKKP